MPFSDRITAIRKTMKLSQERFGELANVSQRTVAFWEAGERTPSFATLSDLADKLGVTVDYILDRPDTKKEPAAQDGELLAVVISRIQGLPDPALSRVSDFLDGLQAGREIAAAAPAAPGSDAAPVE